MQGTVSQNYLILAASSEERHFCMKKVCALLPQEERIWASSIEEAAMQLSTLPLFGNGKIILIDAVDGFKKEERLALRPFLLQPTPSTHLILGASSLKGCSDLPIKESKSLTLINFADEKPWDRKERLLKMVIELAGAANRRLSREASLDLVERCGLDFGLLEQELEKVICFVGQKSTIELQDIQKIGCSAPALTGWQAAEALVWEGKWLSKELTTDLGIIGQVRYHVQLGAEIAFCLEHGMNPTLPHVKEKHLKRARQRSFAFFKKKLLELFELELACKSHSLDPYIYWERFSYDFVAPSQSSG